jgi:hypothetical protein
MIRQNFLGGSKTSPQRLRYVAVNDLSMPDRSSEAVHNLCSRFRENGSALRTRTLVLEHTVVAILKGAYRSRTHKQPKRDNAHLEKVHAIAKLMDIRNARPMCSIDWAIISHALQSMRVEA